jgi:hypothetical protein
MRLKQAGLLIKGKLTVWLDSYLGASQLLSRCSVPKEQSKIARHFNAGKGLEKSSPAGTAEKNAVFSRPCGTRWR